VIHAFWLTTLIPGFALLLLFYPEDVRRGLLATISWCYVLTVALMVPIVVLAFTLHFNVRTVAAYYLVLLAASSIVIMRRGGVGRIAELLRATPWFETGLVLLAIALTVPLGASAQSDSFAHSAKIRFMRDVGFYLQDAYSPLAGVIETKWHVNVHHAFFAVASWLGGSEPLELWFRSAWFFRLLALGAVGFLAASVFRSRWISSLAMLGAVAVMGTKLTIVFPFSVTGFAIAPVLVGLVVEVLVRPSMRQFTRVFLASLTLAALHFGTWFLAAACMGPVVAAWTVWREPVREWWRRLGLATITMITGVPFLLVSALQPNYVVAQQDELHLRMVRTIDLGGWSITIIDPAQYAWMLPLVAVLGLLAIVGRRLRARVLILAAVMACAMAGMFVPGVFDALVRLVPYWLVQRFRNFGEVIGLVMVGGGMAWMVLPRLRTPLARRAFALLVLCGSLAVFRANIQGYVLESNRQKRWLRDSALLQDAVRDALPAHALVVADPVWSLVLPSVHLSRVMAADLHHANPSDGGLLERFADAQEFLAASTTDDRRRQIIQKHGIQFILTRDDPGGAAAVRFDGVGDVISAVHGFRVYKVR